MSNYGHFDGLSLLATLTGPAEIASGEPVPDAGQGDPTPFFIGMGNRYALLVQAQIDSGVELARLGLDPRWHPDQKRIDGYATQTPGTPDATNFWVHHSEVQFDPGSNAEEQYQTVNYAQIMFPTLARKQDTLGASAANYLYTGVALLDWVSFRLVLEIDGGGAIAADDTISIWIVKRGFKAQ